MCGVPFKDKGSVKDLILMLSLKEAIDQLAVTNSVCWYGHVLRRALEFEVEGQWNKGRHQGVHGRSRLRKKQVEEEAGRGRSRYWKKQVEEEAV